MSQHGKEYKRESLMKLSHLNQIPETEVSHNEKVKKKLIVAKGSVKNLIYFSQATFPPNEVAPSHAHSDMTEIFFIQSGHGEIEIDNKIIDLPQGACITVEPGERHELKNRGSSELVVLYFGLQT